MPSNIKLSKDQWFTIGKKAGWIKQSQAAMTTEEEVRFYNAIHQLSIAGHKYKETFETEETEERDPGAWLGVKDVTYGRTFTKILSIKLAGHMVVPYPKELALQKIQEAAVDDPTSFNGGVDKEISSLMLPYDNLSINIKSFDMNPVISKSDMYLVVIILQVVATHFEAK